MSNHIAFAALIGFLFGKHYPKLAAAVLFLPPIIWIMDEKLGISVGTIWNVVVFLFWSRILWLVGMFLVKKAKN